MKEDQYWDWVIKTASERAKAERDGERRIRTIVLAGIAPWLLVGLIVFIALMKDCVGTPIDPIENSTQAAREIVRHLEVRDAAGNGFRVVYATENVVTQELLEQIRERSDVRETFLRLQREAPAHFGGDMMPVDIYDFAALAKEYVPGGLTLQNIFVSGVDKCRLYVRENPKIENCVTWFNFNTEQGAQYINAQDILSRTTRGERIYRYWRCSGNHTISSTDERFSHFSEDERLW